MLVTLLMLAAELGASEAAGPDGESRSDGVSRYGKELERLPELSQETLRLGEDGVVAAAGRWSGRA